MRARYVRAVTALDDLEGAARLSRALDEVACATRPKGALVGVWTKSDRPARIGVVSGSFNPLTRAHVALGEAARQAGKLDAILWTAPTASVGKEGVERAALVDRVIQLRAYSAAHGDGLAALNRGLYVEQAQIVRALTGPVTDLFIVVGFDRIVAMFDQAYYEDRNAALDRLFATASVLVAPRDVQTESAFTTLMNRAENRRYRDKVTFCELDRRYLGDSSSTARTLVQQRGSERRLRALLAPEGLALARLPGVYTTPPQGEMQITGEADLYRKRLRMIAEAAASDIQSRSGTSIAARLAAE